MATTASLVVVGAVAGAVPPARVRTEGAVVVEGVAEVDDAEARMGRIAFSGSGARRRETNG
jgi:hypothetical protein